MCQRPAAIAALCFVAACGAKPTCPVPPDRGDRHELLARLERTVCYGSCPIYRVTIYRDGVVEYEGIDHVKVVGRATARLGPRQLAELDELFQRSGYFRLRDVYRHRNMTDRPTVLTAYSTGACMKTIEHYRGDRSAPEKLSELEDAIDRVIEIERWIGTTDERREAKGY